MGDYTKYVKNIHARGKAVDLWQLIAINDNMIGHIRSPLQTLAKARITKLQATPFLIPFTAYP